ncbi:cytochrome P450 [Rhodocollybia butyracea]|uniref:Cytochrome P450 n=1 Tax=Rhodocollybia butyracea TaxID=206335 RepID=A0A9P5TVD6_9AGAR|nr:cytochrome P450 [Rhodocollybia butyracea]
MLELGPQGWGAILALLWTLFAIRNWRRYRTSSSRLPPYIPEKILPHEPQWIVYARWSRTLGALITIPHMRRPVIVINTREAADDLLTRNKSFACRPYFPMAELLGRQHNVGFTYYGERLKKMRAVLHFSLSKRHISTVWGDLLDSQSLCLCHDLFRLQQGFYDTVESNVQTFIVRLAYGRTPDTKYLKDAQEIMHHTGQALQPGRWAVDNYPLLWWVPSWVPGAGFQRWASDGKELFLSLTRGAFHHVKEEMAQGSGQNSFVRHCLLHFSTNPGFGPEMEDIVMYVAGSLFSAGTETVSGSILTFILLMARHEQIQERAFQEIATVVGLDRLPGPQDADSLPFINALVQEVHRFNPSIPLATHSNYQDEEYRGQRIPRKTWILVNIWAMLHDETVYENPADFIPDRFMQRNPPPDPRDLLYGFGRRRCPGAYIANAFIFHVVARTLSTFKITPDGAPPPLDFACGFVPSPKPFQCHFVPRSHASPLLGL